MDEIKRIQEAYQRRDERYGREGGRIFQLSWKYQPDLFRSFMFETCLLNALIKEGFTDLSDKKIIDIGCGGGAFLRNLMKYGAEPENLYGVDLLENRIEVAMRLSPNINFWRGDARRIPYEGFDIVDQFTVFTSVKSKEMKQDIAKEMLRILKPGGIIIWYDYIWNNPKNTDVQGIKKKEIYHLFQNCNITTHRVTLAPFLTRRVAPVSYILCLISEHIPFLCTHYFAVIRPKNGKQ
ncbi:MAG: class I SAM-dependent methyltransferase [Desulfobacterales bacterium]|nr:class I SAM-dependent methyltransferase [Desulfobacterales bacterium]